MVTYGNHVNDATLLPLPFCVRLALLFSILSFAGVLTKRHLKHEPDWQLFVGAVPKCALTEVYVGQGVERERGWWKDWLPLVIGSYWMPCQETHQFYPNQGCCKYDAMPKDTSLCFSSWKVSAGAGSYSQVANMEMVGAGCAPVCCVCCDASFLSMVDFLDFRGSNLSLLRMHIIVWHARRGDFEKEKYATSQGALAMQGKLSGAWDLRFEFPDDVSWMILFTCFSKYSDLSKW